MDKNAQLRADLEAFIVKHELPTTRIYTQAEWKARGELYGDNTPFVLTTEDILYEGLNYGDPAYIALELYAIAQKYGYYTEQGYAWSVGFYPIHG